MKKVFIIAEAGVNHNGSFELAKKLVDAAKDAGADAVKFQTFKSENLVSRKAEKADYQKKNTGSNESQLEMLKKLELDYDSFLKLADYCKFKGIAFMSTVFDNESIQFLSNIEMPYWKIPSGEITNLPYLKKIGAFNKPVLLSTGMADLGEVEDAIQVLTNSGLDYNKITVLHCTTEYPAPIEEVNLLAMKSMGRAFNLRYGYSDHTEGIAIPIAAAALGAEVIEKHFTLDKGMEGPDHKASLEPVELAEMVNSIRIIEKAMGDGVKRVTKTELKNRSAARKSIVAARPIKKGAVITEDDITIKRPGDGISPMCWELVINSIAAHDFEEDEVFRW
ncbi:N-acetylneuraminate synthase [Gracilinema caldarium]|uniref:N-acetylneuraminate synthase n=1 Tax=Gracilinema caldarium (strain ATCC 51460 / DSM 7334 / H1) TaxID=744872 RepID=F8F019_GRAC1|nr:N-acetylneuraminate synthase [Gracilinema caldarium]AEJ18672.1 N-acetylneuraminate synthase [Gracilinema caldarium DSM 7334]